MSVIKMGSRLPMLVRRFSVSVAETPTTSTVEAAVSDVAKRKLLLNDGSIIVLTGTHVAELIGGLLVCGSALLLGVRYLADKDKSEVMAHSRAEAMAASASFALSFLNGEATFPYQVTEAADNAKSVVEAMEKLKAAVEAMDKLKSSSEAKGSHKHLQ